MYSNQVPQVESQRANEVTDQPTVDEAKSDLLVNNLIYKQPKALSLAKTRTPVRQFFQRSDYLSAPNKTAVIDWNTGASYVDVGNSYLTFKINAQIGVSSGGGNPPPDPGDQGSWGFGKGSAMNCISRITIRSRSGTELDRLEGANLWSKIDTAYSLPENYRTTVGSAMGMDSGNNSFFSTTYEAPVPDRKYAFAIPLRSLSPFFRPLKGQLLPPQLASGLHIEIVFENTDIALVRPGVGGWGLTDYHITDISFMLDTVELSDETQKTLNMESADNGLEWVTPRIYTTKTSIPAGQQQVSVQVRKSCSQATMAYSVLQNSSILSQSLNTQINDSFNSLPPAPNSNVSWQYRIGSLFFPQQPVTEYANRLIESYHQALYAFDKPKHPFHEGAVSFADFNNTDGILAMTASKNDDLFLSGLAINNSRVLEFNYSDGGFAGVDRTLTSFLEYIQVVKTYIDNTAVAI